MPGDVADDAAFVPLVEAAEVANASAEELRKAVKRNELRAVRENPANKRSRWLVALEDVEQMFGPFDAPEYDSDPHTEVTMTTDPEPVVEQGRVEAAPPTVAGAHAREEWESQFVVRTDEQHARIEDQIARAETLVSGANGTIAEQHDRMDGQIARAEALVSVAERHTERTEQQIEQLAHAVEQLASMVAETGSDQSDLLDQMKESLDRAAHAEAQCEKLERRVEELESSSGDLAERLEAERAETQRLRVELETARAEAERATTQADVETEPSPGESMWRRRRTYVRRDTDAQ